jgi:acyl-CoA synthetase (AMP-forming)/AMP-acid ligase II
LLEPGRPDEVDLVAFPVFALLNLRQGITSVLPPWNVRRPDRLDPAATLARLRERRVTRLLVPPAALERLQDHSLPRSVGTVFTGGGPVYPDLVDRLSATSPHVRVGCVYGSTEAEPIAHVFQDEVGPADREAMLGGGGILAGIPVPETRVRIVDDEIWVAGDHVVQGYLDPHDDASTKVREDGIVWHRTGDAGRLDGRKRLWLLGRHGSRVSGVYPFQVEVAARSWPGVRRAALAHVVSSPVIAVEGDGRYRDEWRARAAAAFPGMAVLSIRRMPLDRRHRSKVDMAALNAVLRARATR